MGTLLVKLWGRWRRDRELLKSEDDEALMILRKESQLRKSFSESYPTPHHVTVWGSSYISSSLD